MTVLVDTPVWCLALRRQIRQLNPEQQVLNNSLRELIQEGRAELIDPVRQEVLSGIREGGGGLLLAFSPTNTWLLVQILVGKYLSRECLYPSALLPGIER